ncbi:MAG: ATP-binding protein [Bacillota bacterium]|nr:ATP-binding protein [Bacillota bacterium]
MQTKSTQYKNAAWEEDTRFIDSIVPYWSNLTNESTQRFVTDLVNRFSRNEFRVLLLDPQHQVVVDTGDQYVGKQLSLPEIDSAMQGEGKSQLYRHGMGYVLYSAQPMYDRGDLKGVLFTSRYSLTIFDEVTKVVENIMITCLFGVLISLVIGYLFSDILIDPIDELIEHINNIALGNYDIKVRVRRNDEIGELASAFNLMASRLNLVEEKRRAFVSNVSHELRTPMTSMKIVTDTLLEGEHWEEHIYKDFLKDINMEVDRLNNIIDSLLQLVRMEKEDLEINYATTYVNYLIEWVVNRLRPIAESKQIALSIQTKSKVQIPMDQEKMQQCLINIVGNAIKYTPDGGAVTIHLEENRDRILIEVVDNGIGIPESEIPFIFDRFYRVDEARARSTGGTGLGLAIAQQIVKLHRGTISVESTLDVGTSVTISLPKRILS